VLDGDTIPRPLLIHFWYPADENTDQSNCYFKNYIDLIASREDFNKASSDIDAYSYNFIHAYAGFAQQHYGLDTSITAQKILDCPVDAQQGVDVSGSKKKFPLIIYAPSNSKSSVQNHMICEYLASQGYLVISVGSAGSESINRRNDPESIMAQVFDMEFILNYFEDDLKIKYKGLGLMGFSTGGLANAIFQMRNKKVNAVFSMDGSQEYGSYVSLFNCTDFDLSKTNVPYCLLINNFKDFSVYPFYNSIVANEKYMFRMPVLGHNGFVSFWRFFRANVAGWHPPDSRPLVLLRRYSPGQI
jgi:dienelactone hydrolase